MCLKAGLLHDRLYTNLRAFPRQAATAPATLDVRQRTSGPEPGGSSPPVFERTSPPRQPLASSWRPSNLRPAGRVRSRAGWNLRPQVSRIPPP